MERLPTVTSPAHRTHRARDSCPIRLRKLKCLRASWRRHRLAVFGCVLVLLLNGPLCAKPPAELVVTFQNGIVNWSRGYMETRGLKSPDPLTKTQDAAASALAQARRHLIQLAGAIRMDAFHRVRDLGSLNAAIDPGIAHMVNQLPVFGQQYLSDGTAQITLHMSLLGGFSQLVLPAEIKSIKPLQTLAKMPSGKPSARNRGAPPQSPGCFTGLVVDARGTGLQPALLPRIMDEKGREVYGSAFVSREFAVQRGISAYFTDFQTAVDCPRVKDRPLVVKAVRASGPGKSNVVIRQADAVRLLSVAEHLAFLRKCRVAIVVSAPKRSQGG